MPCRRSLDYKSSSSRTWMERREEGELAEFALPLLGTSVSCAPHLFSHWCGTGPCLLGGWGGGVEECGRGVFVLVGVKGLRAQFWFSGLSCQKKSPSGWVQVRVQSFKLFLSLFFTFFSLFLSPLSLTLCLFSLALHGSGIPTELMKLGTKFCEKLARLPPDMFKHCRRDILLSYTHMHTHTAWRTRQTYTKQIYDCGDKHKKIHTLVAIPAH